MWKLGYEAGLKEAANHPVISTKEDNFKEAGVVVSDSILETIEKYKNENEWKQPYATNRLHNLNWLIQGRLEGKYKIK